MLNKATIEIQPKLARRFMRKVRRDSKAGRKTSAPAAAPASGPAPASAPAPAAEGQQTQGEGAPQAEQADDGGLDSILDACLADIQSDDEPNPTPAPQGSSRASPGDEEDSDAMDIAENLANLGNIRGKSGFRAAQAKSNARRIQHQQAVAAWQSFEVTHAN